MEEGRDDFRRSWQTAFDEENLPPPPDLWHRIEAQLPDDERKTVPFWFISKPYQLASGMAAALVIGLLGWLFFTNNVGVTTPPSVATRTAPTDTQQPVATKSEQSMLSTDNQGYTKAQPALSDNSSLADKRATKQVNPTPTVSFEKQYASADKAARQVASFEVSSERVSPTALTVASTAELRRNKAAEAIPSLAKQPNLTKAIAKSVQTYGTRFATNKRNKIAYEMPEAVLAKTAPPADKSSKFWVGSYTAAASLDWQPTTQGLTDLASASARSFVEDASNYKVSGSFGAANPETSGGTITAADFTPSVASPLQTYRQGQAISAGFTMGQRLNKQLALETGLRYVQSQSPIITNAYLLDGTSGEISSFYENYLASKATVDNVLILNEEQLNNVATQIMLPLQLVYTLPLTNHIQAEVTGGIGTDMLLGNKLSSNATASTTLKSKNSLFRAVNFSGLGGIRLVYLFNKKWGMALGASGQQAMRSVLRDNEAAVTLRPRLVGVHYGINYHF